MEKSSTTVKPDRFLRLLVAAIFLVFFNGYMLAPLIPELAHEFSVPVGKMGYIEPAYLLVYGFSTIFYGPLSDRVGRATVLKFVLGCFSAVTLAVAFAPSYEALLALRALSGLSAGGIVPIVLVLIADIYPYEKLGAPMGAVFGSVAGGIAFGSTFGAWLNPYLGWRNEFIVLAIVTAIFWGLIWHSSGDFPKTTDEPKPLSDVFYGYLAILSQAKSRKTYFVVFMNGLFHSGIFAWLGLYLTQRYSLSAPQIGQALLGYGVPGMLLGPIMGRLADRLGRRLIIPIGAWVASISALVLAPEIPLWAAIVMITVLSAGYDMTQPLLAGIVTSLAPERRGQAIGLNAFLLFTGFGFGALTFQFLMRTGLGTTLLIFGIAQTLLGIFALWAFASERVHVPATGTENSRTNSEG
ncbi:MAG: MFS transporter [Proteobacteria bacterium]|nr:MAG: MFS transporter [Pseudomonadota bacterium]